MLRTNLLFCLVAALAGTANAQPAPSKQQEQMIAADRAALEALSDPSTAVAKLEKLLAPEYTEVELGRVYSRADVIGQIPQITGFTYTYSDPIATMTSADAGYVIATVRDAYTVGPYSHRRFVKTTTVMALRNGIWMPTLHAEETMLYDPETIRASAEDSAPELIAMRKLASEVTAAIQIPGYAPFPYFSVAFDAGAGVSYSDLAGAHEADFAKLPLPMQKVWNEWASYTKDEASGQALFTDMFYRFFLVHELGHLIVSRVIYGMPDAQRDQVLANMNSNAIERELVPNRISIAWFREHDPAYLARLVTDFRLIEAHLPNPVPAGQDPGHYFSANYRKLGQDPVAYGWYQLYMVIKTYDEAPRSFQQILASLPAIRYSEN